MLRFGVVLTAVALLGTPVQWFLAWGRCITPEETSDKSARVQISMVVVRY